MAKSCVVSPNRKAIMSVKVAGPEWDEYMAQIREEMAANGQPEKGPLDRTYFKDDPNRDEQSVRGCFLDEIYSRPNMEERLAEKYFDGDVPWMYDNMDNLPEQSYDEFFTEYLKEAGPRADRKYKIIFYGMSGYTGSLVMEYLKRECLDDFEVAFSGRTLKKVEAMRDKLSLIHI